MLYGIGLMIYGAVFIFTIPYKKHFRKKLLTNASKFKFLVGMSLFLVDCLIKTGLLKKEKYKVQMQQITAKENVSICQYTYIVDKMSTTLLVTFFVLLAGMGLGFSEKNNGITSIDTLTKDNQIDKEYEFTVKGEDGKKENVIVDLPRRRMKEDEVKKVFESAKKKLPKIILGQNKSADKVEYPLNLTDYLEDSDVIIVWDVGDENIVLTDGNLGENISSQGQPVELTATLMKDNYTETFSFFVNVFPPKKTMDWQKALQLYVDSSNPTDKDVLLPDKLGNQNVRYYEGEEESSDWLIACGIIAAIAIFFLKDRDLSKALEERKNQLEMDYSEIVSKLLLYYGAGLSIASALEKIVVEYRKEKNNNADYFRYAYEELEIAVNKIKSGISETKAIRSYGVRCGVHCYIKLSNLIEQNIKRGSKDLTLALKGEMAEALQERKNAALKKGEKISTKLLAPMIMMFFISVAMIIVPAFLSIKF